MDEDDEDDVKRDGTRGGVPGALYSRELRTSQAKPLHEKEEKKMVRKAAVKAKTAGGQLCRHQRALVASPLQRHWLLSRAAS